MITIKSKVVKSTSSATKLVAIVAALAGIGLHTGNSLAATYYVDPASGNDANAGTSQSAPWKTIPGTKTTSNSGWLRTAWGSVTTAAKLQPGDIVELKAGGSMTSSIGGKLVIDANYYNHGTATAPITIRVSSTWGSGHFTYNMSGMTNSQYHGMVEILTRNYITISGADATRRFVIQNAPGDIGMLIYGSSATHSMGQKINYVEIANSNSQGFDVSYADGWTVSNSISHDNGIIGFSIGGINDANTKNGTFIDSESYRNGLAQTGDAISHGFGNFGTTNTTFIRCKSHDNRRDGFDNGTTANANSLSATFVDSASYNNGEDGWGVNGGTTGTVTMNIINSVAYNNGQAGFNIYDAPVIGIYNSVIHNNGNGSSFGGNILTFTDAGFPAPRITLRNNIFYKPKKFAQIGTYTSSIVPIIDSDYNIYVPRAANTETFSDYPFGTYKTYASPPSWVGAHDKLGIAYDPGFVSISLTDFNANDYHLKAGTGPAINTGIALTSIARADKDRDGNTRASPPELGMYEYGGSTTPTPKLAPPTNLRVVP